MIAATRAGVRRPVTFLDSFTRADGPIGNGWLVRNAGGVKPAISAGVVVGNGSTTYEAARSLGFTPASVQFLAGNIATPGDYFHVLCGTDFGPSLVAWTGVSFSQGQAGDYRIWTWVAGAATQQVLVNGAGASGIAKLRRVGNVYTGSVAGVDRISWTDNGLIAKWGSCTAFLIGGNAAVTETADDFTAAA